MGKKSLKWPQRGQPRTHLLAHPCHPPLMKGKMTFPRFFCWVTIDHFSNLTCYMIGYHSRASQHRARQTTRAWRREGGRRGGSRGGRAGWRQQRVPSRRRRQRSAASSRGGSREGRIRPPKASFSPAPIRRWIRWNSWIRWIRGRTQSQKLHFYLWSADRPASCLGQIRFCLGSNW